MCPVHYLKGASFWFIVFFFYQYSFISGVILIGRAEAEGDIFIMADGL